jgi:hypothetical protein
MHLDFALDSLAAGSPTVANDIDNAILRGPSSLTFTRASDANVWDETGTMVTLTDDNHRFDHNPAIIKPDGTYEKLGILIEGAATNLLLQSEDFTTTWVEHSVTATSNSLAAPDGNTTADTISNNAVAPSTYHYIRQSLSLTQNETYTESIDVKYKAGSGWIWLLGETSGDKFVYFDIKNGVIGGETGPGTTDAKGIIDLGGGWYRCWFTFTKTSANASEQLGLGLTTADVTESWDSTGAADQEQVYVWGAQLENTAYPTSYIATTSSSVTRAADVCSMTDVSWANTDYSGSFVVEYDWHALIDNKTLWELADTVSSDNVKNLFKAASGINYQAGGEVTAFNCNHTTVPTVFVPEKTGLALAATNDAEGYFNGVQEGSDTNYTLPTNAPNSFFIGANKIAAANSFFNGHIKNIRYWPRRLNDTEMIALTNNG